MKCYQCSNNAMYLVGSERVPLCLHCFSIHQQAAQRNTEMLREEMNYLYDSVDAMFGISTGPRYPTKRPVIVSGPTTQNYININDSQIGVLNTGNLKNLNQSIKNLYSNSVSEVADKIKVFVQVTVDDTSISPEQKNEIIESIDFIANEILQPQKDRRGGIVKVLFSRISEITNFSASVYTLWKALESVVKNFFLT